MPAQRVDREIWHLVGPILDLNDQPVELAYNAAGIDVGLFRNRASGVYEGNSIDLAPFSDPSPAYRWLHIGSGVHLIKIAASGAAVISNDHPGTIWCIGVANNVRPFRSFMLDEVLPANVYDALFRGIIELASTGVGPRVVTVTVDDGTDPLQGARVRVTKPGFSHTVLTDSDGVALFALGDGDWDVAIDLPGYTFTPTTLEVDGAESPTYSMTIVATLEASNPGAITGQLTALDEDSLGAAGIEFFWNLFKPGATSTGFGFVSTQKTTTSGVGGITSFPNLVPGEWYRFRRGVGGTPHDHQIPANAGNGYELPSIIGRV